MASSTTRRDFLKKAGRVGAGAVAAGALTGQAGAATKRLTRTTKAVPTGGTVTWALEQDPGFIAPFGQILSAGRWATELMYESLLEWDPRLNVRNAIASAYDVVSPTKIVWTIRPGIKFSNGNPVTPADVVYSFQQQLNPPLPGSTSVLGQVPAIASVEAGPGSNKVTMNLTKPDARIYGYLAWQRYSMIVPNNMYSQLNASTQGIGTGPFMLNGSYVPNDHVNYVKNPHYWKPGLPYLDGVNYPIVLDEQTRIAALLSGSIDGATVSQPNAANLIGNSAVSVLHGLTAAFRELQFTIKAGQNKPWYDKRVRAAVNFAINRANIVSKVYGGFGVNSGHVAAGYGPWPLTQDELMSQYEKYDLPTAKSLMKQAGVNGFSVTMTTFATPGDFASVAALIANDLQQIGITVNIVPQDTATFAANNGTGAFDWDLTSRGMRGDVDGYVAEFHPSSTAYQNWFTGYPGNKAMWRLIGNGRIQLNPAKRLPMYQQLDKILLTELLEVPLVSVSKWQVVRPRLKNMYVAFTDFNTGLRNAYVENA